MKIAKMAHSEPAFAVAKASDRHPRYNISVDYGHGSYTLVTLERVAHIYIESHHYMKHQAQHGDELEGAMPPVRLEDREDGAQRTRDRCGE